MTLNLPDVVRDMTIDPTWTHHAIRHEFGHALGLMHEHQRSLCDGWFNVEAIAENQGWTVDFAKSQVGSFPDSDLAGGQPLVPTRLVFPSPSCDAGEPKCTPCFQLESLRPVGA